MGKVIASELNDVHVDFVSIVTEGANGETFKIFRRAREEARKEAKGTNATPEGGAKEGEEQMTPEEKAVLEKAAKEVETLTKANAELVARLVKSDEAYAVSQKALADLSVRVETIEKEAKDEPAVEEETAEVSAEIVELTKTIETLSEQVAKLSGQKREPAGKGTTEEEPETKKAGLFRGVFFGNR